MKNIKVIFLIAVFLQSCSVLNSFNKAKYKNVKQSKNKSAKNTEDSKDNFVPKYKCNTYKGEKGKRPCIDFINGRKSREEAEIISQKEKINSLIKDLERKIKKIKNSENEEIAEESKIDDLRILNLEKIIDQIKELRNKVESIENSVLIIELGKNMEKFLCAEKTLKNHKIQKIKSDYSFDTGKSKLKSYGKQNVKYFINEIKKEISKWKNDIECNKVFSDNEYKAIIEIYGYTDLQGSGGFDNLGLSKKRAQAVQNEINLQMRNNPEFQYEIFIYPKGEKLPPGMKDNSKKDDPRRRICILKSIVGPMILLNEL